MVYMTLRYLTLFRGSFLRTQGYLILLNTVFTVYRIPEGISRPRPEMNLLLFSRFNLKYYST